MSGSIRLSPKHGVNPSVMVCFYCGEDFGVALPGMISSYDREAPRRAVWGMDPCSKCEEWMKQGIILLGIDPAQSDPKKGAEGFHRTGQFVVMKEEAFDRVFNGEAKDFGMKHRWCFVEEKVMDQLMDPEFLNFVEKNDERVG